MCRRVLIVTVTIIAEYEYGPGRENDSAVREHAASILLLFCIGAMLIFSHLCRNMT